MRLGTALSASLVIGGCGGSAAPTGPALRVAAAPVLEAALKRCTPKIDGVRVRLEIARSDRIGDEIRRGVLPDVFMAGNTGLPRALAREGKVDRPVTFATNALVIAVPSGDRAIGELAELARADHPMAMGTVSSPLGSYTRFVLGHLSTFERIQVLSRVRVQAPEADELLDKVVSQEVQGAFVFGSDARSAGDRVRAVALPPDLGATVAYAMATVKGSPQPRAAQRVVADVLKGGCARELRDAGFGPPPR